jgi:hypothetical protein
VDFTSKEKQLNMIKPAKQTLEYNYQHVRLPTCEESTTQEENTRHQPRSKMD